MSTNPALEVAVSFGLNLASAYAEKAITAGYLRIYNIVRDSPQERALHDATAVAFAAFLRELAKGLSRPEVDTVEQECHRFFKESDIADYLLATGLAGEMLDVDWLVTRFVESGAADRLVNIRIDLPRGLAVYHRTLLQLLLDRASEAGSPLFNPAVLARLNHIQSQIDRLFPLFAQLASTPAGPARPLQRPVRIQHFTGRTDQLAQLLADLQPSRTVTLCGPGGVGKSALAAEAIWTVAPGDEPPERFPDGIIFHTFYHQPQAGLALEKIARAYGVDPRPSPRDAALQALAGKTALLVLDGTEAADDLPAVLSVAGSCGVLITTRRREDSRDDSRDIEPLPRAESLELLRSWAGKYAAEDAAANEIVRMLGGLPLALYLAGRYLGQRKQQAGEYVAWLKEEELEALHFGARPSKSVPLLLRRSLDQVSEQAQAAFGVTGILALAPFEAAVVAAALDIKPGAANHALGELVDYGLLLRPDDGYQVTHVLAHSYARTKAALGAFNINHLALYYGTLAEAESAKGLSGYAVLDDQRAHIVAVQAAALKAEQWKVVQQVTWKVRGYLDLKGYWTDRVTVVQAGIDAARAAGDRYAEMAFLNDLGLAYVGLGEPRRAIALYEQALVIGREIGDRRGEGAALGNLGIAYKNLGAPRRAIALYQQQLVIVREICDRRGEGAALDNLGNAYADLGEPRRAIALYEQALVIARETGDRRGEGAALGSIGAAYGELGEPRRAIDFYEQQLLISRKIGDRRGEGYALGHLGRAKAENGNVAESLALGRQYLAIIQEIGDRGLEGDALSYLGYAYQVSGDYAQALILHKQGIILLEKVGRHEELSLAFVDLAESHLALGEAAAAAHAAQRAIQLATERGYRLRLAAALWVLARAQVASNDRSQALDLAQQALDIYAALDHSQAHTIRSQMEIWRSS